MQNLGYYNGDVAPLEDLKIPALDRAFYFGDGVYDAAYSRNYKIFALNEHVDRFFNSAAKIGITPPIARGELCSLLNRLVRRLDTAENMLYFQVSRGTALREHRYPEKGTPNLLIMIYPKSITGYEARATCITLPDTRFLHCDVKSLNLIPSVQAAQAASAQNADEAIFIRDGFVTECSHCNVHILKDGALLTPPDGCHILSGIGRAHLIATAKALKIPVIKRRFAKEELFSADEVLLTSAGIPLQAVSAIDGVAVGGKSDALFLQLARALTQEFTSATN